jgi:hypothetical protein
MFNPNSAFLLVQELKSAPKGFTLGVKAEIEEKKNLSISPKLLINAEFYGLLLAPRLKKRIQSNLGGPFATIGANVLAFINNFGPICNPKMLKVGPKFFWALTPSVM